MLSATTLAVSVNGRNTFVILCNSATYFIPIRFRDLISKPFGDAFILKIEKKDIPTLKKNQNKKAAE
jgi:hypothetical protein